MEAPGPVTRTSGQTLDGNDVGPIYCQCSNASCGALLRLHSRYKQGQVVNCPDCETPFMISPESPEKNIKCEEPANGPQYGFGFTPEADGFGSGSLFSQGMKKEALFQFPSPSSLSNADLELLQLPDNAEIVDPTMLTQIRNMTPSAAEPKAPQFSNVSKSSAKLFGADPVTTRPAPEPPVAPTKRSKPSAVAVPNVTLSLLCCKYCNKVFKKAGRLLTHERKHTGERPFSCTECTKSFRDCAALEGHIARQHRTQPYHCTTCSKGFSSQRQLKIHARVHSGEKPFDCAVCHRKFSQEGNLHTHIRRHMANFGLEALGDSGQRRQCKLCNTVIANETELKTHVKYHIKANDLHRLQDFTPSAVWMSDSAEGEASATDSEASRKMSVGSSNISIETSDGSRRESLESNESDGDSAFAPANTGVSPMKLDGPMMKLEHTGGHISSTMTSLMTNCFPSPTTKLLQPLLEPVMSFSLPTQSSRQA